MAKRELMARIEKLENLLEVFKDNLNDPTISESKRAECNVLLNMAIKMIDGIKSGELTDADAPALSAMITTPQHDQARLSFKEFALYTATREIVLADGSLALLQPSEFKVFIQLCENVNRPVSFDPSPSLLVRISNIRRKCPSLDISTVRGKVATYMLRAAPR